MLKKSNLFFNILVAGVLTIPLYLVSSVIIMLVLQAIGLKRPDQYLDEVMLVDQIQFIFVVFFVAFLILTVLFGLLNTSSKNSKST